jgi:hypothetical protein
VRVLLGLHLDKGAGTVIKIFYDFYYGQRNVGMVPRSWLLVLWLLFFPVHCVFISILCIRLFLNYCSETWDCIQIPVIPPLSIRNGNNFIFFCLIVLEHTCSSCWEHGFYSLQHQPHFPWGRTFWPSHIVPFSASHENQTIPSFTYRILNFSLTSLWPSLWTKLCMPFSDLIYLNFNEYNLCNVS